MCTFGTAYQRVAFTFVVELKSFYLATIVGALTLVVLFIQPHTRPEQPKIVHIPKLHFKVKPTKRPRKKNLLLKDKTVKRFKNCQN